MKDDLVRPLLPNESRRDDQVVVLEEDEVLRIRFLENR